MRRIALDIETTGLDPKVGHKVIEIGCVELDNNFPTGRIWQKYINPKRTMPQEAYEIHGLTEEFLSDKPEFKETVEEFLKFIKGAELIIHNAVFDLKFLKYEFDLLSRNDLNEFEIIDTLKMARKLFPGMPASLDALCRRYRIDISKRIKHGALLDAELLAEVFLEMQGGRQQGINLVSKKKQYPTLKKSNTQYRYSKKIYSITDMEMKSHKKLMDLLKK